MTLSTYDKKNNYYVFERPFKVLKNAIFLFGKPLEILFIQYLTILAVSKPHGVIAFFNLHNLQKRHYLMCPKFPKMSNCVL